MNKLTSELQQIIPFLLVRSDVWEFLRAIEMQNEASSFQPLRWAVHSSSIWTAADDWVSSPHALLPKDDRFVVGHTWTLCTSFHFKCKRSQSYQHEHFVLNGACAARARVLGSESSELVLVASATLAFKTKWSSAPLVHSCFFHLSLFFLGRGWREKGEEGAFLHVIMGHKLPSGHHFWY